ncbi:MAG: hypothetical protein ACI4XA_01490, partial [Oscillospiraceae bacterium]
AVVVAVVAAVVVAVVVAVVAAVVVAVVVAVVIAVVVSDVTALSDVTPISEEDVTDDSEDVLPAQPAMSAAQSNAAIIFVIFFTIYLRNTAPYCFIYGAGRNVCFAFSG